MKDQSILRKIAVAGFVLVLVVLAIHIEMAVRFNAKVEHTHGNDSSRNTYMEIDARQNSTSTWLKRNFELDGRAVDLIGSTIDGTLHNNSGDTLEDWTLRINITQDCFVNQAWNGEVEIRQFAGTEKETVQRMNLQDYRLEDVKMEYRYDGDLLIPLQPGDSIVYYPARQFREAPVNSNDSVKIGMIFYYLGELDLADYDLDYRYHRNFAQGVTFYVLCGLVLLWILSEVMYGTNRITYRRAEREMQLRKSSLASMSEIYKIIYIINLATDEMTPVSPGNDIEQRRKKKNSASWLLAELVEADVTDAYRQVMREFCDCSTLAERLKGRDSIAMEFTSRLHGWCSMRFIAMDSGKEEDEAPESVIFAVQDTNDEKKSQAETAERISRAESKNRSNAELLRAISLELEQPIRELKETNEQIIAHSGEEQVRAAAKNVRGTLDQVLSVIEGTADTVGNGPDEIRANDEGYSLRTVLEESLRTVLPEAEKQGTEFLADISDSLPRGLRGDRERLGEALLSLLFAALRQPGVRNIKFSAFGKSMENRKVHLLFSVRSESKEGAPEAEGPDGMSRLNAEIAARLLRSIGTELRTVAPEDGRREVYFEIEQQIEDPEPIGPVGPESLQAWN